MLAHSDWSLVLIGMMGAGKSTVGRKLAAARHKDFVDTDKSIEIDQGVSISQMFELSGEEFFRQRETELLRSYVGRGNTIIATGGGIICRAENRKLLAQIGLRVYIKLSFETILERVTRNTKRPLVRTANPEESLRKIYEEREHLYAESADIVFNTEGKSFSRSIKELSELIIDFYAHQTLNRKHETLRRT